MASSASSKFNAVSHSSHKHFDHTGFALFRYFDPAVVELDDMHLQRFHQEVAGIPAVSDTSMALSEAP